MTPRPPSLPPGMQAICFFFNLRTVLIPSERKSDRFWIKLSTPPTHPPPSPFLPYLRLPLLQPPPFYLILSKMLDLSLEVPPTTRTCQS